MQTFKIRINLKSSIITPFHADTLWGHICWALRYTDEGRLDDFLGSYATKEPPLIISNAFPEGYLPYPILAPMEKRIAVALVQKYWAETSMLEGINTLRMLSRMEYVSRRVLTEIARAQVSNYQVIETILGNPRICPKIGDFLEDQCPEKYDSKGKIACGFISSSGRRCPLRFEESLKKVRTHTEIMCHSKIDRLSGSALERALFTTEDRFCGSEYFESYCNIGDSFSEEVLRGCLEFINKDGYGRKKTTGKGNIRCTLEKGDPRIPISEKANAFMTLSNYVPKSDDPVKGYYRLFTKYGKLGGHFASSPMPSGVNPMPFKYPVIMFEAGSIFAPNKRDSHYGRLVTGVHPMSDPKVLHYGIAYPLFLRIEGWNE